MLQRSYVDAAAWSTCPWKGHYAAGRISQTTQGP